MKWWGLVFALALGSCAAIPVGAGAVLGFGASAIGLGTEILKIENPPPEPIPFSTGYDF